MHDVFISYSTKDKVVADAACAKLEAGGLRCWIAPRDILPGTDWGGSIVEAIEGARLMVLVLSASADASPQILREVERAVNKGLRILPLRIEDIKPGKNLEYFLGTPHWLDAITPPMEKHLEYLVQTARMLLDHDVAAPENAAPAHEAPAATAASAPPTATAPLHRGAPLPRRAIVAAAVILVLIAIGLIWWTRSGGGGDLDRFAGTWTAGSASGPGHVGFTLTVARDGAYHYQIQYEETGQIVARGGLAYLESNNGLERAAGPFTNAATPAPANLTSAIPARLWAIIGRFSNSSLTPPATDQFRSVSDRAGTAGGAEWEWYPTVNSVVWRIQFVLPSSGAYRLTATAVDAGKLTVANGIWSASSTVLNATTGGNYSFVSNGSLVMTGTIRGVVTTTGNGQVLWERSTPVAIAEVTPRALPSITAAAEPTAAAAATSAAVATAAMSPTAAATPAIVTTDKRFIITHSSPVYTQPDTSSAVIGRVRRSRRVHVTGYVNNWLRIELSGGGVGFIPVSAAE